MKLHVLLINSLALLAPPCSFAAGRVFYDDFESGTLAKWKSEGAEICTNSVHSGKYALRCNWNGTVPWNDPRAKTGLYLDRWDYDREFFVRFWVRYDEDVDHKVGAKLLRFGFGGKDEQFWGLQNEMGDQATLLIGLSAHGVAGTFWGKGCPPLGDHKWHKYEMYVRHDTNGQDGLIRYWVDGQKIYERTGATDNDGGKWYPWHIISNWSNNPGWEHDADNHTYWDDIEIFSDTGKGEVSGSMEEGTILSAGAPGSGRTAKLPGTAAEGSKEPEQLLLKDYRPRSIYNVPVTDIKRARFPVIDMHAHDHGRTDAEVAEWVRTMDELNIRKTIVLSQAHGKEFDEIIARYKRFPGRFSVWCAFDYTGYDKPDYGPAAVAELERCFKAGAEGVGEMGDKGKGMFFVDPPGWGMHFDDARMDPLLEKCGELGMPISIHVADPKWMYEPMDKSNDGLMNAYSWRLDNQTDALSHAELLGTLERAVKKHPRTTFVACHVANCCYDLSKLGALFDKYPNLYADISARYAEMAPIPRTVCKFFEKYQDRLVYGTDMGRNPKMYLTTFRILETEDEHFYDWGLFTYHWPLHGLALPNKVLRKVYSGNAQKILEKASR